MSRFTFCNCPAGFSAAPERHAPDCPGRFGVGKRGPTPVPATVKPTGEPKRYPDRLCHIDYTAHPHRCGCVSGDDEAQRRFDEYQRDTKLAKAESTVERLTAERDALQQLLNAADQRIDELKAALKFYADSEHYHFESGNWDTVSGEPMNILWCGDEPDFIEDGTVARAALNPTTEAASHEKH